MKFNKPFPSLYLLAATVTLCWPALVSGKRDLSSDKPLGRSPGQPDKVPKCNASTLRAYQEDRSDFPLVEDVLYGRNMDTEQRTILFDCAYTLVKCITDMLGNIAHGKPPSNRACCPVDILFFLCPPKDSARPTRRPSRTSRRPSTTPAGADMGEPNYEPSSAPQSMPDNPTKRPSKISTTSKPEDEPASEQTTTIPVGNRPSASTKPNKRPLIAKKPTSESEGDDELDEQVSSTRQPSTSAKPSSASGASGEVSTGQQKTPEPEPSTPEPRPTTPASKPPASETKPPTPETKQPNPGTKRPFRPPFYIRRTTTKVPDAKDNDPKKRDDDGSDKDDDSGDEDDNIDGDDDKDDD